MWGRDSGLVVLRDAIEKRHVPMHLTIIRPGSKSTFVGRTWGRVGTALYRLGDSAVVPELVRLAEQHLRTLPQASVGSSQLEAAEEWHDLYAIVLAAEPFRPEQMGRLVMEHVENASALRGRYPSDTLTQTITSSLIPAPSPSSPLARAFPGWIPSTS